MAVADEGAGAAAKPLGLWMATALVVGSMIGSGVFLLPAALAPYGAASLIGWAITLCGALLLAATFARLAVANPATGGPYAYAHRSFGDLAGFGIAWSYWISIWSGMAAIAVAFAGSVGALVPAVAASPALGAACALGAIWLCAAANIAGLREAGLIQLVLTSLKLLPLLLFGLLALWFVDTHHYRPFNPTRQAWPQLAASRGVVLNVGSVAGISGSMTVGRVAHSASKGGVIAVTRQLAAEGGPAGIRVNSISPGLIATEGAAESLLSPDHPMTKIGRHIPLGRVGTAEEVVNVALFLASDAAAYVSGANVTVDGGWSAVLNSPPLEA